MNFGSYVRNIREQHRLLDRCYSVRQTAHRIGVEPAYLSKVERGDVPPPSEDTIRRLAVDLDEDIDLLLALAGKVSSDIREIVIKRPILLAAIIRSLGKMTDDRLVHIANYVSNHNLLCK